MTHEELEQKLLALEIGLLGLIECMRTLTASAEKANNIVEIHNKILGLILGTRDKT